MSSKRAGPTFQGAARHRGGNLLDVEMHICKLLGSFRVKSLQGFRFRAVGVTSQAHESLKPVGLQTPASTLALAYANGLVSTRFGTEEALQTRRTIFNLHVRGKKGNPGSRMILP